MTHQIRNGLSLKQEERGKNAPRTVLSSIIRNVFTLRAPKVVTTMPVQITVESPRKLAEKANLEKATTVAEGLLRRALTLQ